MKNWSRILICLLVLLMLPLSTPVFAAEEDLEQKIIDSCYYGQKIDLSEYELTLEDLDELYYRLHDAGSLAWYTERKYFNYELDEATGMVLTFEPKLLPASRYDRAVYQQRLEEIYQECVLEGMEPWQIALSVHDYLVAHTAYDEFTKERDGYELLTNGKAVCSGYTEVYRELMRMAGIPCVSVVSEEMNHTWNLVCLDGEWYHVDVTWDDPVPDQYGYASHRFFLLTDEQISSGSEPHYSWGGDIKCTDTTYTNAFFREVYSPVCFTDASTCYLVREENYENRIYRRDISAGKESLVYQETDEYINLGEGYYFYLHYGLSYWNDRLWVNNLDRVISMRPDGSDIREEFTYDARKHKRYIAGCYVYKDTLRYSTLEHGGYPEKRKEALEPTGYHIHSYTQTVTPPTCDVPGYTESVCDCGIACKSTPVIPLEHNWERSGGVKPTLFAAGSYTETCAQCGKEVTRPLEKLSWKAWMQENRGIIAGAACGLLLVIVLPIFLLRKKKPDPVMLE